MLGVGFNDILTEGDAFTKEDADPSSTILYNDEQPTTEVRLTLRAWLRMVA